MKNQKNRPEKSHEIIGLSIGFLTAFIPFVNIGALALAFTVQFFGDGFPVVSESKIPYIDKTAKDISGWLSTGIGIGIAASLLVHTILSVAGGILVTLAIGALLLATTGILVSIADSEVSEG